MKDKKIFVGIKGRNVILNPTEEDECDFILPIKKGEIEKMRREYSMADFINN